MSEARVALQAFERGGDEGIIEDDNVGSWHGPVADEEEEEDDEEEEEEGAGRNTAHEGTVRDNEHCHGAAAARDSTRRAAAAALDVDGDHTADGSFHRGVVESQREVEETAVAELLTMVMEAPSTLHSLSPGIQALLFDEVCLVQIGAQQNRERVCVCACMCVPVRLSLSLCPPPRIHPCPIISSSPHTNSSRRSRCKLADISE